MINLNLMKIVYLHRAKSNKEFSIEKVFEVISAPFNSVHEYLPFRSRFYLIPLNILYTIFLRFWYGNKVIFHITGDVHYICFFLPRDRTILTIHDCSILERAHGLKRIIFFLIWYYWPICWVKNLTTISEVIRRKLLKINPSAKLKVRVIPNPITIKYEDFDNRNKSLEKH